jgi:hypothetical protein
MTSPATATPLSVPRRRFNADGSAIVECPEQDPAAARRYAIDYWRGILEATYPDGSASYTQAARALAQLLGLAITEHRGLAMAAWQGGGHA